MQPKATSLICENESGFYHKNLLLVGKLLPSTDSFHLWNMSLNKILEVIEKKRNLK